MLLFTLIIIFSQILIILLNYFCVPALASLSLGFIVGAVIVSTFVEVIIDGLTCGIIRILPKKWFNPFYKRFKIFKFEKSLYKVLKINKIKDYIPDLGCFTNFRKNKIDDPYNNEYIFRYLLEATYGRVGHFASLFSGFLVVFLYPIKYCLNFGIPVAIVNFILNLIVLMALRCNFPKLLIIYKRNEMRNKQ